MNNCYELIYSVLFFSDTPQPSTSKADADIVQESRFTPPSKEPTKKSSSASSISSTIEKLRKKPSINKSKEVGSTAQLSFFGQFKILLYQWCYLNYFCFSSWLSVIAMITRKISITLCGHHLLIRAVMAVQN